MQEEYHNDKAQGAQKAAGNKDAPNEAERNDDLA
jgi:hypothetical protein